MISATTRVAGVIGDPVDHSLSPAIHNAAFRAAGLDWVFVALPTPRGAAAAAVQGMRALGIRGLSVTMPHKADVIASLDQLGPAAERLGSVNCITARDGILIGDNTDGAGFLGGLRADFGMDPAGADCVVLGAGGAARAVVLALAEAGAASVTVVNRSAANAARAAELGGAAAIVGDASAIASADLVVNATPVGMGWTPDRRPILPCDESLLRTGQVVAELIYHPAETPLMAAARRQGARTANGSSMLVHQAAAAFEHWTGVAAPRAAMAAAVASPDQDVAHR